MQKCTKFGGNYGENVHVKGIKSLFFKKCKKLQKLSKMRKMGLIKMC